MRVGVQLADFGEGWSFAERVAEIRAAAVDGARSIWVNNGRHVDALTILAVAGQDRALHDCRLGTAVLPVYGRDPQLFTRQIASTQASLRGPLSVGLGASHPTSPAAGALAAARQSPLRDVRELVEAIRSVLPDVVAKVGGAQPGIYLSTGGPKMLEMAISVGVDGVLSTLTTLRTYQDVFLPNAAAHASAYGRAVPEIVASEHVCLTDDREGCLQRLAPYIALLDSLVRYRAVMDRQGLQSAAECFIVGDERTIRDRFQAYGDAGVDEFVGVVVGTPEERARTRSFIASLPSGR